MTPRPKLQRPHAHARLCSIRAGDAAGKRVACGPPLSEGARSRTVPRSDCSMRSAPAGDCSRVSEGVPFWLGFERTLKGTQPVCGSPKKNIHVKQDRWGHCFLTSGIPGSARNWIWKTSIILQMPVSQCQHWRETNLAYKKKVLRK